MKSCVEIALSHSMVTCPGMAMCRDTMRCIKTSLSQAPSRCIGTGARPPLSPKIYSAVGARGERDGASAVGFFVCAWFFERAPQHPAVAD